MDALISHNGRVVEAETARVAATVAGLQYGWGVFTTLRIVGGVVFVFDRHWERLVRHAERARIAMPFAKRDAAQALAELINANQVEHGRARFTVFKGAGGSWRTGSESESEALIFTATEAKPTRAREFSLTISPYRILSTNPLAGVKRTAMLENLLAFDEARHRQFDEAVLLNERGEIVSATAGNIFWSDGRELYTPTVATGCIAGITRALILDAARRINIHAVEASFPLQTLSTASEVFLTSTARGIMPIKNYDMRVYDTRAASMTRNISREYQKLSSR